MSNYIAAHLAHCRRAGFSPETIRERRYVLEQMDDELPYGLDDANADEIGDWLAGPEHEPWKPWTRWTRYTHATQFYRWTLEKGYFDDDPTAGLPRPPRPYCLPNPVTEPMRKRVFAEAAKPYRLWALLAAYAGLRCCEIARADKEDMTEDSITVLGKGNKPRSIPTRPEIWRSVRALPSGPIVRLQNGERASARYVSQAAYKHFAYELGVPTGLHRFRHWFGTETYRRTRNLRAVQELMGHASITTTAGYTLVVDEERRAAIQALPALTDTEADS